eukprot:TRINITY_DN20631_c0_g1_i4.p1 TRINITY_DN20631_c0_g1~~TRINITY_DN20631_c0_g1_i4.p1  ORF type:complete len:176 (+),score=9.78 TRINITY_DN20631_c0_g1_i4:179-706(+)
MASNFFVSLRTVLSKRVIDAEYQDPQNFMAILHCGSFLLLAPVGLALEGEHLDEMLESRNWVVIPFVGVLVWIFNIASIMVLSWTSPVTYSLIRTLRRPMLVIASIIAFGTHIKPLNMTGLGISFFGVWLYNHHEFRPTVFKAGLSRACTATGGFVRTRSGGRSTGSSLQPEEHS